MLGLSATVTRRDGHHPIVFMQYGPVRFRASEKAEATNDACRLPVVIHWQVLPFRRACKEDYLMDSGERWGGSPMLRYGNLVALLGTGVLKSTGPVLTQTVGLGSTSPGEAGALAGGDAFGTNG